jgi:hypothetical protein
MPKDLVVCLFMIVLDTLNLSPLNAMKVQEVSFFWRFTAFRLSRAEVTTGQPKSLKRACRTPQLSLGRFRLVW